jgi:hypothetical protein
MYLREGERNDDEIWGQDAVVRRFNSTGVEVYLEAMRWIRQNIDPESTELRTKRFLKSVDNVEVEKAEVIEKIYNEFRKYGFTREEADLAYGGKLTIYTVKDAKAYLKLAKKYLSEGVLPFYPMSSAYSTNDGDKEALYNLLAENRWINLLNIHWIRVPLDSSRIWPSFDYALQASLASEINIGFQDRSQVEEYREKFNGYKPIAGKTVKAGVERYFIKPF